MDYNLTIRPVEILCLLPGLATLLLLARSYRVVKLQKRIVELEQEVLISHQEILFLEQDNTRLRGGETMLAKSIA